MTHQPENLAKLTTMITTVDPAATNEGSEFPVLTHGATTRRHLVRASVRADRRLSRCARSAVSGPSRAGSFARVSRSDPRHERAFCAQCGGPARSVAPVAKPGRVGQAEEPPHRLTWPRLGGW